MKNISVFILCCICINAAGQNVGIGTVMPLTKLHIVGTGEVVRIEGTGPWIGFTNNFNPSTYLGFVYFSNGMILGTKATTNLPVALAPNNVTALYATAAGNIGINTLTPTERLDVNGSINFSGPLKINGNSGVAGKVLRSNGAGLPNGWASATNDLYFGTILDTLSTEASIVGFANKDIFTRMITLTGNAKVKVTACYEGYGTNVSTSISMGPFTFPSYSFGNGSPTGMLSGVNIGLFGLGAGTYTLIFNVYNGGGYTTNIYGAQNAFIGRQYHTRMITEIIYQ